MKPLFDHFQTYLSAVTGLRVSGQERVLDDLPHFLAQSYALYALTVAGQHVLGIVLREPDRFQPARFEKQLDRLLQAGGQGDRYCVIAENLPGYVRQRLVMRRIPFVIPGRQVNWPMLGAVIEARSGHEKPQPRSERVKPATQLVILNALNKKESGPFIPEMLARHLGYTSMTMSRALDEIEEHGLGRVLRVGRERRLDFPDGLMALWEHAKPLLRDPVRETVRVWERELPGEGVYGAGETALAKRTMMVAPHEPVKAIGRNDWKPLATTLERIPIPEPGAIQLQIWRYDPGLLASNGLVDRFSLYLNLRETMDERVQMALDAVMESAQWSED